MFVKALLVSFFLASSTLALAPPQLHKRDIHNRHAHVVARTPVPVLASQPLGRRHTRTKRCTKRPQTPDTGSPIKVESVEPSASPAPAPATSQPSDPAPPPPSPPNDPPAQPEQPPPSGGSYGETLEGEGTYYDAGLGACGYTNTNADYIAAVSRKLFDTYPGYAGPGTNPNNNPICGKTINVSFEGKTVSVVIVDRCEACEYGDVDFTPTAFGHLGDHGRGRLRGIRWAFPNPN